MEPEYIFCPFLHITCNIIQIQYTLVLLPDGKIRKHLPRLAYEACKWSQGKLVDKISVKHTQKKNKKKKTSKWGKCLPTSFPFQTTVFLFQVNFSYFWFEFWKFILKLDPWHPSQQYSMLVLRQSGRASKSRLVDWAKKLWHENASIKFQPLF